MPDPPAKTKVADPTLEGGDVDEAVLPCEQNDVEVVGDLEEPNTIEFESGPEDEEPAAIVFAAMTQEPGGSVLHFGDEEPDDESEPEESDDEESGDVEEDPGQDDNGSDA